MSDDNQYVVFRANGTKHVGTNERIVSQEHTPQSVDQQLQVVENVGESGLHLVTASDVLGTYDTVEAAQLFANGQLGATDAAIVDEKQQRINELEDVLETIRENASSARKCVRRIKLEQGPTPPWVKRMTSSFSTIERIADQNQQ